MSPKGLAAYYVVLSAIGATFLGVVAWRSPASSPIPSADRVLVASAFVAVCVLGFASAVRPNRIRRLTSGWSHGLRGGPAPASRPYRGHHPDCEHFAAHVIRMGARTLCAGCTGLGIGAFVAAILMAVYAWLLGGLPVNPPAAVLVFGVGLVTLNYVEVAIRRGHAMVHTAANVLLVLGFLFLTVGTVEATGKAAYGLLAVVVSLLMVDTRIRLSSWRHVDLRRRCGEACDAVGGPATSGG